MSSKKPRNDQDQDSPPATSSRTIPTTSTRITISVPSLRNKKKSRRIGPSSVDGPGSSEDTVSYDDPTPIRPSISNLSESSSGSKTSATTASTIVSLNKGKHGTNERSSQTDWWLTDAPKVEHGLRRTFNPASSYTELDSLRSTPDDVESRVKLEDIQGTIDKERLVTTLKVLVTAAFILIILGLMFFFHLILVSLIVNSAEYLSEFLKDHIFALLLMFCGIFHPILLSLYCFYCIRHLHLVRTYYLRALASLIIPILVFFLLIGITIHIERNMEADFRQWMHTYFKGATIPRKMWDLAQTSLRCCGLENRLDWIPFLNNKTVERSLSSRLPDSCCVEPETCADINNALNGTVYGAWPHGCIGKLKYDIYGIMIVYLFISLSQIIVQIVTIIWMRKYYELIKQHFTRRTSVYRILGGRLGILCEQCFSPEIAEVEDTHELEHDLLPRDKYGDLQFKAPFPWKT